MIIWSLWLQGADQLPPMQARCIASWRDRNPDCEVRLLDRHSVADWIDIDIDHLVSLGAAPQALSDLIRICLLDRHGGVWVDATTLCLVPLARWLPVFSQRGFFAFDRPQPSRRVASWFLYGEPGNVIVSAWQQATQRFWASGPPQVPAQGGPHWQVKASEHLQKSLPYPYFWFHCLFNDLVDQDPAVQQAFAQMPGLSADLPHRARILGLDRAPSDAVFDQLVSGIAPLLKLDSRLDMAACLPGSLIHRLLERA